MKVLQVDSDVAFARQLRGEMLRHGAVLCDFEQCATVEEAILRLYDERFDVLVVDPFSQCEESLAACTTLRAAAPDSPIVVLSSVNDTAVAIDAVCAGAHDYLLKEESQVGWLMRRVRYAIERTKYQHRGRHIAAPHSAARMQVNALVTVGSARGTFSPAQRELGNSLLRFSSERPHPDRPAKTPLRVLHVEDDPTFARLARRFLTLNHTVEIDTTHVTDWSQASAALKKGEYDAVLLDLTLPDRQGMELLQDVLPASGGSPVLVLSGRDDDGLAIESLQAGAEDFLIKGDINMRYLGRAALLAVTRRTQRWPTSLVEQSGTPSAVKKAPVSARVNPSPSINQNAAASVSQSAGANDRRQHSRYILTKPIFAIPIRPDSSPAEAQTADGFSVDMSAGGIKLELRGIDRLPTKYLLVGIEDNTADMHFATVEARHIVPVEGGLSIGAHFVSAERDLIRRENLEPHFRPETKTFATGLPLDVLGKWCELGIFRPKLVDRVLLCPQCQGVATFRKGCRSCGSVRLHSRPLFHHFACAHVGFVGEFEQEGGIVCPKCRTKNLIVGADYEHLSGPFRCLDCDWSDTELDLVGQCLRCELRFPANQAVEEDLVGYHVERLDPMAFISAT